LVRVCVVYDTKYGNTKLVAEKIAEGLREVGGIQTAISDVEGVDHETLRGYDAVLIGSPNHYSGPTKGVQDFIDELGGHNLEGKAYAVFDTFVGKDSDFFLRKGCEEDGEENRREGSRPEAVNTWSVYKGRRDKGPYRGRGASQMQRFRQKDRESTNRAQFLA